jgi:hypothetical protein
MIGDEILTVVEVAAELRCSKAHVCKAILGRINNIDPLPAICLGRRKLVRRGALEKWKRMNEKNGENGKITSCQQSTP